MKLPTSSENQDVSYIVYDKVTGLPIGRHRHLDAVANKLVAADEEEILSLYAADEGTMQRVTDADAANLAVIQANLPEAQARFKMRIIKDRLVEQPKLVMFSDRDELEGNGEDKATLTIQVQDDKGKVISKANDAVLVTTTRGKLSERGGEIVLEKGRASITLTSVPETVRVVTVRAELVKGGAKPVEIRLAFM